jgi:hypothetical protein
MKRATTFLMVLAVAATASADYTYTVGPGQRARSSISGTESMLIHGGWGEDVYCYDKSLLRIESTAPNDPGPGGVAHAWLGNNTSLEMTGGDVGQVTIGNAASASISGGRVGYLSIYDSAHMTLSGGSFYHLYSYQDVPLAPVGDPPTLVPCPHITLVCRDYTFNALTNLLTGNWADQTPFSIQLYDKNTQYTAFENIGFTMVPEPVTLGLLTIGSLLLRRGKMPVG